MVLSLQGYLVVLLQETIMDGRWALIRHHCFLEYRSIIQSRLECLDTSEAEEISKTVCLDLLVEWRVTAEGRRKVDFK